ncbi:MAG: ELWxxDGT repeat protein [Bacteroidota bacterium]
MSLKKIALFILFMAGVVYNSKAQLPQLVKDINASTNTSTPDNITISGSNVFFAANTNANGRELLKIDPVTSQVSIVKDLLPGSSSGNPALLTNVNGTLFFSSSSALWKSDGTDAGTMIVKSFTSSPAMLTNVNGTIFFTAFDAVSGVELWKSNGTEAGTTLVKDITPGTGSTIMASLTEANGLLYFMPTTATEGRELWRSDGTDAGTFILKDIFIGTGNGTGNLAAGFNTLCNVNGTVFFAATDGTTGNELWKTDGTVVGTILVSDIITGATASNPSNFFNYNGTLLFSASFPGVGIELCKSDGTAAGTVLVKEINVGNGFSGSPKYFTELNGQVYFTATDAAGIGEELYKTDGTEAGTVLVADIAPGLNSGVPTQIKKLGNKIIFYANASGAGFEPFVSDGTPSGTVLLKDIYLGNTGSLTLTTAAPIVFGQTAYFVATDGILGNEIWKTDATTETTILVNDVNTTGIGSSLPTTLTAVNGKAIFVATRNDIGNELWISNGTDIGTTLLKDIRPGANSSDPSGLSAMGNAVYFSATDATSTELWKSDGTVDGTVRLKDFYPSSTTSGNPRTLTNFNNNLLLFFARQPGTGTELWKSDGTEAGTVLLKDVNPTNTTGNLNGDAIVVVGNLAFFAGNDGVNGEELWKTDGTTAGTVLVKDLAAGNISSSPEGLASINGVLYFYLETSTTTELWKSDGTDVGTMMIKEFSRSSFSGSNEFYSFNGHCYFINGGDSTAENGLWRTNGTEAGTEKLSFVQTTSNISILSAASAALFYRAPLSDINSQSVLWKTDGTAAGTVAVGGANNVSNNLITSVSRFIMYDNTLYFSSSDVPAGFVVPQGTELWKCADNETTAVFLGNIAPESAAAYPQNFLGIGNTLFFSAETPTLGAELYKYAINNSVTCSPTSTWTGNTSAAWEDASNWTNGVPCAITAATVPAGMPRYPVINNNTTVKSITATAGTTINVATGVNLIIAGN